MTALFLENERIRLRAPELADLDLLYDWENDSTIWNLSNTVAPFSRFILKQYLENAHLDIYATKQLRFMIEAAQKTKGEKTVGCIDLFDFDPYHARAGVGILIAPKAERKKGYASEALEVLIKYSFNKLGLHQLFCNISVENEVSLKLFEKFGFKVIGTKKDWNRDIGGWNDELLLQLLSTVRIP